MHARIGCCGTGSAVIVHSGWTGHGGQSSRRRHRTRCYHETASRGSLSRPSPRSRDTSVDRTEPSILHIRVYVRFYEALPRGIPVTVSGGKWHLVGAELRWPSHDGTLVTRDC